MKYAKLRVLMTNNLSNVDSKALMMDNVYETAAKAYAEKEKSKVADSKVPTQYAQCIRDAEKAAKAVMAPAEVGKVRCGGACEEVSVIDRGYGLFVRVPDGRAEYVIVESHSKNYTLRNVSLENTEIEVQGLRDIYTDWFTVVIKYVNDDAVCISMQRGDLGRVSGIKVVLYDEKTLYTYDDIEIDGMTTSEFQ